MHLAKPPAGKLLVGLLLALFPGCAWQITPPPSVADPVPVVLTEYSRHTRLALPIPPLESASGNDFIEYGFGDWDYYGLEDQSYGAGLRAILGWGSGAFSRRQVSAPPPDFDFGGSRSTVLQVDRLRVEKLRQALEARWQGNSERVVRRWDGVPVSRDPRGYHLLHNSNAESAAWLRDLGVEVRGHPILSNFQVRELSQ